MTWAEGRSRLSEFSIVSETSVAHEGALRVEIGRQRQPLVDPRLSPQELDALCEGLARIEAEAARRPASTDLIDKEITSVSGLLEAKVEELWGVCSVSSDRPLCSQQKSALTPSQPSNAS
jgi:hypothetical protein